MDPKFKECFNCVKFYIELIENTETLQKMTMDSMKNMFQASVFIEKVIKKVKDEKKEVIFENNINALMAQKTKSKSYSCSYLEKISDKFLEVCLREKKISDCIIDELLKIYIKEFGGLRLEANINRIFTHSMQANAILKTLKNLDFPHEDIDDEVLIASWEHEIKFGRQMKVKAQLEDMFSKQRSAGIIQLAYKSDARSKVHSLIVDFFVRKLIDNDFLLYSELCSSKKKVLLRLLENPKFQLNFIDATFYIGRNMKEDEEEVWVTDSGFSYADLKSVINVLLDGPEDLYKLTVDRIKLAKELDVVWENIERDCII